MVDDATKEAYFPLKPPGEYFLFCLLTIPRHECSVQRKQYSLHGIKTLSLDGSHYRANASAAVLRTQSTTDDCSEPFNAGIDLLFLSRFCLVQIISKLFYINGKCFCINGSCMHGTCQHSVSEEVYQKYLMHVINCILF